MTTVSIEGFRVSHQQQDLWQLEVAEAGGGGGSRAWALFRFAGEIDFERLRGALRRLFARHQIFRTAFRVLPDVGVPLQVIAEETPEPTWELRDLTRLDPARRAAEEEAFLAFQHGLPLDLECPPLWRFGILVREEGECLLSVVASALCADVWTLRILFTELADLYAARETDHRVDEEDVLQYVQFSEWQHELGEEDGEAARQGREFWHRWRSRHVASAAAPLPFELPSAVRTPSPPESPLPWGGRPSEIPLRVEGETLQRLRALAGQQETSLETVLLAGWFALLGRWADPPAPTVVLRLDGRKYLELEEVMGPLAQPLPLILELQASWTFPDLVRQLHGLLAGVRERQEYLPLLEPDSVYADAAAGRRPTATLGFDFTTWPAPRQAAATSFSLLAVEAPVGAPGLRLSWVEEESSLHGTLVVDPGRFTAVDVERLATHLATLLAGISRQSDPLQPRKRLPELELLPPAERRALVVELNASTRRLRGRGFDPGRRADVAPPLVPRLFAGQARRQPDAPALHCAGTEVTYRQLYLAANRLARRLGRLGIGPEATVGLFLERSAEAIVALLAVLKAGAAYVPLEVSQPRERLGLMLESAGVALVLTREPLRDRLPTGWSEGSAGAGGGAGRVVCLDPLDALPEAAEPEEDPDRRIEPENLVYVIFTSGSTGRPKAVGVEHRQLAGYVAGILERLDAAPGDRFATGSSLAADLGNTSVFPSLCSGGCLHLIPEAMVLDPAGLARTFRECPVDVLKIVPSHLEGLLRGAAEATDPLSLLPRKWLVLGGEGSRADWARELGRRASCRILNHYGPSETTVGVTTWELTAESLDPRCATLPIGRPLPGQRVYLLDAGGEPVPRWVPGELYIAGAGLTRGYLTQPGATAARFLPAPFPEAPGATPGGRCYRTGDRARYLADGSIEFLGRTDQQIKLRGYRIELGEIEAVLEQHPQVRAAAALLYRPDAGSPQLLACIVPRGTKDGGQGEAELEHLRRFLRARLPEPMVPVLAVVDSLPFLSSGKIDRRSLLREVERRNRAARLPPRNDLERRILEVWCQVLGLESIGVDENFFDLGGHSLLLMQVHGRLREMGYEPEITELFAHPTVESLAAFLGGEGTEPATESGPPVQPVAGRGHTPAAAAAPGAAPAIAVIGMAGRFPGARNTGELWRNLAAGVESVRHLSRAELATTGLPAELLDDPNYVGAAGVLDDIDLFDAGFFGFSPREATITDPQHRLFLEACWQAMEDAGYAPGTTEARVGVYAGAGLNFYLVRLMSNPELLRSVGLRQILLGNRNDFLATRVSYKLDLKGPSFNVQTGCSTSLAAVALACDGLLGAHCDMALAGGVRVHPDQGKGYLYQEGEVVSRDGRTRAFDARASGTVGGNGVGVVLLKRLADALADGDPVRAVIRGWSVNNDGSRKVGFMAPGLEGQAQVVAEAQAKAGVHPDEISYIEAHGTGTRLGDPIEIAALSRAFRRGTRRRGFCAVGSVKTNLGHLDAAAGVTGLIKTVLALQHRQIPPSLHFEEPNPEIPFGDGPFYVNTELRDWPAPGHPRRAGVSSFGIGGTNVHVLLEEAPQPPDAGPSRAWQLLPLSARTPEALAALTARLEEHLEGRPDSAVPDLAFTLQTGRKSFAQRRFLLCRSAADGLAALRDADTRRVFTSSCRHRHRPVVFLFPGQGSQRPGMGRELYRSEKTFRFEVDRCLERLRTTGEGELAAELHRLFAPGTDGRSTERIDLQATRLAQPALFVFEHALARLWQSWGITPAAMAGHSLGEIVAACLAGTFSLEDALSLVVERGRLMGSLPGGAMLSVALPAGEALAALADEQGAPVHEIFLTAENAPGFCVLSGAEPAVLAARDRLVARGAQCRLLHTSHAFHSAMMEPILERFVAAVRRCRLAPPRSPFLSNLTGTWIRAEQATDPDYWGRQLRQPVRFDRNLEELFLQPEAVLLEVGPGNGLSTLARRHPERPANLPVLASCPEPKTEEPELAVLLRGLGQLWLAGAPVDWKAFQAGERRRRVTAPTYPFEGRPYWVESDTAEVFSSLGEGGEGDRQEEVGTPAEQPRAGGTLHPRPLLDTPLVEPRTPAEHCLASIWRELLGLEEVGVDDDFFALGGDSVLTVQILSRARQAGLQLTAAQVFANPTIARLADLAGTAEMVWAEQGPVVGEVFLTPIQRRFFEHRSPDPHHYNQSLLLAVGEETRPALLIRAVAALMAHHDALRLRFAGEVESVRAWCPPPGGPIPASWVDLSALAGAAREAVLERTCQALQERFDLARGPLFASVCFDFGAGAGRFFMVAHHLVIDAVSWRFLVEDLATAYAQLQRGEAVRLPAKTSSYKSWAERLPVLAADAALEEELAFWLDQPWHLVSPLPVDRRLSARPSVESSESVVGELEAEETRVLLQQVPQRFGVQINDVLLTVLGRVLGRWTGDPAVLFDLEGHGREPLVPDLDVSRTVGWFTTVFPVLLRLEDTSWRRALASTRRRLQAIPRKGLGYGLLRHLHPQAAALAERLPRPEVVFFYFGQLDTTLAKNPLFTLAPEPAGSTHSRREPRRYSLMVIASVTGQQLRLAWNYSSELHDRSTVRKLSDDYLATLRQLIEESSAGEPTQQGEG